MSYYVANYGMTREQYYTQIQNELKQYVLNMRVVQSSVDIETLSLDGADGYIQMNTKQNNLINIKINQTLRIYEMHSVNEIVNMLETAIFAILNTNINDLSEENNNVDFIIQNGQSVILTALVNSAMLYLTMFQDHLESSDQLYNGLFSGALCILFLTLTAVFLLLRLMENKRQMVLSFLLELPIIHVKNLYKTCGNFVNTNQAEDQFGEVESRSEGQENTQGNRFLENGNFTN